MTDKLISQMSMFDFTAPVNTVMVFEDDSDDETCCSSPKKQKIDNSITTSLHKEYYSLHHEVDITSSSDEDVKKDTKVIDMNENKENIAVNNHEISSNYNSDQEIPKHVKEVCVNSNKLQNEENIDIGNTIDNKGSEQQNSHDKIRTSNTNKENAFEKSIPDQVNTVTSFSNSNQSNDIEIMSSYLKKLINTVSDHLLKILEAYRLYVNVQNTGNQLFIERSRVHYFQVKHHFFKLSFLVVKTIFVPQIHSYTFARNFIECTVRIAKKNSLKCSYEDIEPLYLEMIEWTKTKSVEFKKISLSYMNSKWHLTSQQNITPTEGTNKKGPNLYAHPQTLPGNNNANIHSTTGLQMYESISNQHHPQNPLLQTTLNRPSLPSYEEITNLQRNSVFNLQNYVYSNNYCQSNNDTAHYTSNSLPSLSNSSRDYNHSVLPNALRGSTCSSNGTCVLRNCVYCRQIQFNNGIPQQNVTLPNVSPATSLDPSNFNVY